MAANEREAASPQLPELAGKRFLFVVTGSINAALTPFWFHWLRQTHTAISSHAIVTRSAQRFVTREALRHLVEGTVWTDDWDDPELPPSAHISLDAEVDGYAVFPATIDFTMRLAAGASNTPASMALQITKKPIVLATAFPESNEIIEAQLKALLRRPNVKLSGTVPAYSVGKGAWTGETGFYMPSVLEAMRNLIVVTEACDAK
ncbi:flavoprotein [Streptomyces javensis]|uniref:flavoprotein n=1 Tax=Streptomyces javensis TaxID=114698 RepID=UPI0033F2CAA3